MTELARTRPESFFADRFNVTRSLLERVLGSNLIGRADDADIYLEYRVNEELQLEEGTVKKASRHVSQGAGVRALSGTRTGYAHTDDISLQNLEEAARQARAIADRAGVSGAVAVPSRGRPHDLYALAEPPLVTDLAKKLDLLRKVDGAARAADPRVKQVIASLTSEEVVTLVATASGWTVGDVRPLMRLNVTAIAEAGGKREIGAYGGGGRVAFDFFLEDGRWRRFALEAARQAVLKLGAVNAPAGTMTVVLGPGWPGILLHEAVGHGLEGDFNRKGTSAFAGRMGQKVASELVTVIDDGTIPNRRGSLNVDDEGTPTGRTVLIEKGVLVGYMQDRLNARLMGMVATGNGRRESYAYPPMPRMTNTFMPAGEDDPEDIIKSVRRGLYAVSFGGGQVDITNGKFVFSASEAYLVEDGRVIVSLTSEEVVTLIATASGWTVGDVRPLTRLNVTAIAEERGKREIGAHGGGGRVALDFFLEDERWRRFAREAARQAVLKLRAVDAPAGTMTVVLRPGWPGILLHEAVGHGLEGDFNRKGTSAFAGRMGQKVASELVTVIDDGTIPNRRGSLNVDDEGTPTGRTVLIEKGVLVGYMQDRLNARLMGMAATGNGRRESYAYPPMPRMTNTFMPAGEDDPEDIIKSVRRGLYAVSFGGGQVDITNGKFVFSASEAYLVEDGRVTSPVKGATLIGNGPEALTRVVRVGRDLKLDEGVGTCGKEGQSVPVGVGLPTIRIDDLTVGGTAV